MTDMLESSVGEPSLTTAVYCATEVVVLNEDELLAAGWMQRTVTDPNRIGELEELYQSVGFETTVVPLDPDSFGDSCNDCAVTACAEYLALFTRKR
ncbi:MAG: hypothetical protein M5U23_09915 [Acidimicrobiia bacterium]|nr:hypothetical protein [Acidimicrobiia bacterium]